MMFRVSAPGASIARVDADPGSDREGRPDFKAAGRIGRVEPECPASDGAVRVEAEREFVQAIEAYKITSGRMFPTWSEVLEVLVHLGYVKMEDCRERAS